PPWPSGLVWDWAAAAAGQTGRHSRVPRSAVSSAADCEGKSPKSRPLASTESSHWLPAKSLPVSSWPAPVPGPDKVTSSHLLIRCPSISAPTLRPDISLARATGHFTCLPQPELCSLTPRDHTAIF